MQRVKKNHEQETYLCQGVKNSVLLLLFHPVMVQCVTRRLLRSSRSRSLPSSSCSKQHTSYTRGAIQWAKEIKRKVIISQRWVSVAERSLSLANRLWRYIVWQTFRF